ncbi:hypothetical protein [Pedobacter rhizosphaerae]|uniref:Uncharacterized protein n=1 Tax=Pedobacter rhizosphaerae TaxID=390241 RepID=A0A1H9URQ0_9SPHI|nr:hypothetical protein [Pedobacter rhizosphaerae]SES12076.1 hypothetical protein SAMN04488023_13328 [Pedobacter rhizosphaerae]
MNKHILTLGITLLTLLGFSVNSWAQPRLSASNQQYMEVRSSQTQTFSNAFQIQITLEGNNRNYPNWSLGAILNQPITNSEGKTLPYGKIKLKLSAVNGATFQQIGSGTTAVPLSAPGNTALLINSSNYALKNSNSDYYSQIIFTVDVILEGGTYLDALKTWQAYSLNLAFTLLDNRGAELSRSSATNGMQIRPDGTYTTPASYGIQVQNDAKSGLLELKTMNDYLNGASVTYTNGLTVTAATPYAIQVRSSSANFMAGSKALPVSVVNLQLSSASGSSSITIPMAETAQTIGNGGTTTTSAVNYKYHIRYFTKANDSRLINAVPDTYSGIIIYEIIPQ